MKIRIEISKRIFLFYLILNAIGYNPKIYPVHPLRKKTRDFLKNISRKKAGFEKIRKILNDENLKKEFWFPFRTWILCHSQPPNFKEENSIWKKNLKNEISEEFKNECLNLWNKGGIKSFWKQISKEYYKIRNICLIESKSAVKHSMSYLRLSKKT